MGRLRTSRRVAWVAVIALALRLLLPVLTLPVAGAAGSAAAALQDVLGPVMICTSHGLVPLEDGSQPSPQPVTMDHCPACALAKVLSLAVMLAVVLLVVARPRSLAWPLLPAPRSPHRLRPGGISARGPPLPA